MRISDWSSDVGSSDLNAPGSYAEFIKLTTIKEEPGLTEAPDWREMVHQLVVGNEAVCRTARQVLKTADDASDDPSVDLLTQRLQQHNKYHRILRHTLPYMRKKPGQKREGQYRYIP